MAIESEGPNVSHLATPIFLFLVQGQARPEQSHRHAQSSSQGTSEIVVACMHAPHMWKQVRAFLAWRAAGGESHTPDERLPTLYTGDRSSQQGGFCVPVSGIPRTAHKDDDLRVAEEASLICSGGGLHHQGLPLRAAMWTLSGNMKHE